MSLSQPHSLSPPRLLSLPRLLSMPRLLSLTIFCIVCNVAPPEQTCGQTPEKTSPSIRSPALAEDRALKRIGVLQSPEISESSGLARSHYRSDAWWTMNDSGHGSQVYLFGSQGQTLAVCTLEDARNRDWEAMSSFQRDGEAFLMVADVGDNLSKRPNCQLYVFREPRVVFKNEAVFTKKLSSKKFTFRYQDGPRNCEAVACQSDGSVVYLVEKIFLGKNFKNRPGVYRLELPFPNDLLQGKQNRIGTLKNREGLNGQVSGEEADKKTNKQTDANNQTESNKGHTETVLVAKRVADFPFRGVTGMSISPDGKRMVVRNYLNAHLFSKPQRDSQERSWEELITHSKPAPVALPLQVQAEAICFTNDNKHLVVTSETARQTVWKVKVDSSGEANAKKK